MKAWHDRDPVAFQREKVEVEQAHPRLHFSVREGEVRISGSLEIKEGSKILDRFSIEIQLPADYPEGVPVVFETAGRIPHTLDRHCYDTGASCLFLPEERWRAWPKGSSLLQLIDGPVRNYFIGQSVFECDGVWPFDQWDHGFLGRKQYYRELLGTDDPGKVRRYFEILTAKKIKGHWECPCGSGQKLRACHMTLAIDLRDKIPRDELKKAAHILENELRRLSDVRDNSTSQ